MHFTALACAEYGHRICPAHDEILLNAGQPVFDGLAAVLLALALDSLNVPGSWLSPLISSMPS
jgi:hypothetical protein